MSLDINDKKFLKKVKAGSGRVGTLMYNDFWNEMPSIIALVNKLVSNKGIEPTAGNKMRVRVLPGGIAAPWFFVKHGLNRDCLLWHDVYFDNLGFIHSACMSCWKTVIYTNKDPQKQTVLDLFKLRDLMIKLQLPSKCGCDVRNYTKARYDGFIYGDTLEQGQLYHGIAKEAVMKEFPDAEVILKRACTEYEKKFPKSNEWQCTSHQLDLEDKLNNIFAPTDASQYVTTDLAQARVFSLWIEYAYQIGDPTWRDALMYEGYEDPGPSLYSEAVTYHDKTPEELRDMMTPKTTPPVEGGKTGE